jgi:FkbM family methyltransferase
MPAEGRPERVDEYVRRLAILLLPPLVTNAIRAWRRGLVPSVAELPAVVAEPVEGVIEPGAEPVIAVRRYWGLYELDRQIERYLDFDGGYFVELGANDGKLSSNTFYFEEFRSWRGVLIEPAPNLYLKCRESRAPQNHMVCAACVSFDYRDEFVKLIYSNSMSVSLNVETDIGDPTAHAELGRQFLAGCETVFTFGAIARTLDSILLEANAPKTIDFLSLDVEGSEVDVLRGVNHETYKFRYMLIECRNLARLQAYLEPLNYRLVERFNEHDYLFAYGREGA